MADTIVISEIENRTIEVGTVGPQGPAGTGLDTLTTKGDTLGHNGTSAVRVPVGTNGQVLTADSTATPGVKWATPASSAAWADITGKPSTFPPEAHTHSGDTLTPAAIRPTDGLRLVGAAPATPAAGDLYRISDTLRYRDGSNVERLLLNATDNLANLANAATARTNLGLGTGDSPTFTNLTLTRGTITTSSPVAITQTWNASGVTFTALDVNVTNTASASASVLADFRLGGTRQVAVGRAGELLWNTTNTPALVPIANGFNFRLFTGSNIVSFGNPYAAVGDGAYFGFSSTGDASVSANHDIRLYRNGTRTAAFYNSTNAMTLQIFGTRTDSSNGRWLSISSTTTGVFSITPTGNGTGASGNVLHISGLPTSNPGPGILWNNAGSVAIGT